MTEGITYKDVLDLLASERRRKVVKFFEHMDNDVEIPLRDVARSIASDEESKTPSEVSDSEIRRVYIALYQYHMDNFSEKNVLEYVNEKEKVVTPGPNKDHLARILRITADLTKTINQQ